MNQLGTNHLLYLLIAAQWTVVLSLIAFAGGSVLGLAIALMRVSKLAVLRGLASGYIQLIQGTPLLILLFLSYFGLGIVGLKLVPLVAAGISFTLYAGAFLGEIWRGCIEAVPKTQWEASDCLGLNRFQQYAYVVLPQAMRIAIPRTDRQQLDLRAIRDLLLRRRHLLRAVLPAVGGQPLSREEGPCRQVRRPSSASAT